jgi:WD40 repeat protein
LFIKFNGFYLIKYILGNFTNAQLRNSVIADARLNNCQFVNTDLSNVKYGRFPDLKGHRDRVFRIAFTLDSKILASGGGGGTIKLWNLETL